MPNRKKKASERKTCYIGMRATQRQKERWSKLAKVRGMTESEVMTEAVEGLLLDPKWEKNRCIAYIYAAAKIIEESENGRKDG